MTLREKIAQTIVGPRDGKHLESGKLEELQEVRWNWPETNRNDALSAADAILSIIADSVPPLVWETSNKTIYWCYTVYGRYSVFETLEGEGHVGLPGVPGVSVRGGINGAIEAANAHYRQAILKAAGIEV